MSSYGIFADFYDTLTLNVDYSGRADYIIRVLKNLGHDMGKTLDLACGTGSLTLALAERGVEIIGADASSEMLTQAYDKALGSGYDILFLCQKMRDLELIKKIDTCVCTLDSINHMTDTEDVRKTFKSVSENMKSGGFFIFDVNTVFKHREVLGCNTFVYDVDEVFCVWENSLKENNVVEICLNFFVPEGELYDRYEESFSERAYTDEEICSMLSEAGFKLRARYGDMTENPPKEDEQRVIYIAEKR